MESNRRPPASPSLPGGTLSVTPGGRTQRQHKQALRYLTCYSDDALTSTVVSIETLVIHDLQTMVTIIQQPTHL